jgi:hypothetical protein
VHWAKDKNYEESQAKIYNEANIAISGQATAEQIRKKTSDQNFDPKTILYLFDQDTMKGYVQARIVSKINEVHIGFPWVLEGIDTETQTKLFTELLNYIKNEKKYQDYKIRMNMFVKPKKNIEFIEKLGFKKSNDWIRYYYKLNEISNKSYKDIYAHKVATKDDIETLVQIMKADKRYSGNFDSDDKMRNYFVKVFEIGHVIIIYAKNQPKAAGAPLVFEGKNIDGQLEKRIIVRFEAYTDSEYRFEHIPLTIEIAKECLSSGYGSDIPFVVNLDNVETPVFQKEFYKNIAYLKKEDIFYYFYL